MILIARGEVRVLWRNEEGNKAIVRVKGKTFFEWRVPIEKIMEGVTVGSEKLTPSEFRVLEGVSCGLSNKDIAKKIHLTERTVKFHMQHIFIKMGVRSRYELFALHKAA